MISDPQTKSRVKIKPLKRLGQNFLIDKSVINKIIRAGKLKKTDIVLEIGPGTGILTQEIAKKVKKVIAVEKDPRMCEILKENLKDFSKVEIIEGDILKFNIENPKSEIRISKQIQNPKFQILKTYKIIANLPFYLTAVVIRKFLEAEKPPCEMVLIVQKEVAQRICSKPPHMSLLAISVQFYSEPKIIDYVSKKSFWPQPKVDSAIIKIVPRSSAYISAKFRDQFFRIVKIGFSHPRKQILNNFKKELKLDKEQIKSWLTKNNIQSSQRAETLSLQNWIDLTKTFVL